MRAFRRTGRYLTAVVVALSVTAALSLTGGTALAGSGGVSTDGRWDRLATTGEAVSARSAPTALGIGSWLYVFGGGMASFATGQATFYNDLHRLDVRTRAWVR